MPYDWMRHKDLPLKIIDSFHLDQKRDALRTVVQVMDERFVQSGLTDYESKLHRDTVEALENLEALIRHRDRRRSEPVAAPSVIEDDLPPDSIVVIPEDDLSPTDLWATIAKAFEQ